jgi:hypothetical protein
MNLANGYQNPTTQANIMVSQCETNKKRSMSDQGIIYMYSDNGKIPFLLNLLDLQASLIGEKLPMLERKRSFLRKNDGTFLIPEAEIK